MKINDTENAVFDDKGTLHIIMFKSIELCLKV